MQGRFGGRRTSPSLVISVVALFIALGGTSYAVVALPRNSVGSKQIKMNAVTSKKVKDGSLKAADFGVGQLPAGPAGPAGLTGPQGTPGEAAAFARVQPNGTLLPVVGAFTGPSQAKNIAAANITHPAAGVYCFNGLGFTPSSATVASDNAGASTPAQNAVVVSVAIERGNGLGGCATTPATQARVIATNVDPAGTAAANVDKGFTIWFER